MNLLPILPRVIIHESIIQARGKQGVFRFSCSVNSAPNHVRVGLLVMAQQSHHHHVIIVYTIHRRELFLFALKRSPTRFRQATLP